MSKKVDFLKTTYIFRKNHNQNMNLVDLNEIKAEGFRYFLNGIHKLIGYGRTIPLKIKSKKQQKNRFIKKISNGTRLKWDRWYQPFFKQKLNRFLERSKKHFSRNTSIHGASADWFSSANKKLLRNFVLEKKNAISIVELHSITKRCNSTI